ncbi:hypothetical protein BHOIPH791_01430 [Bartonella henselae]
MMKIQGIINVSNTSDSFSKMQRNVSRNSVIFGNNVNAKVVGNVVIGSKAEVF